MRRLTPELFFSEKEKDARARRAHLQVSETAARRRSMQKKMLREQGVQQESALYHSSLLNKKPAASPVNKHERLFSEADMEAAIRASIDEQRRKVLDGFRASGVVDDTATASTSAFLLPSPVSSPERKKAKGDRILGGAGYDAAIELDGEDGSGGSGDVDDYDEGVFSNFSRYL